MYQNPYMNRMTNPIQTGILWVQGIEGAKAWQLAPNSNVILMDSENDGRFYIKTSDNVGMCNLRIFKYEEVKHTPSSGDIDLSEYVRKDELQNLISNMVGGRKDEQPISAIKPSSNTSLAVITE